MTLRQQPPAWLLSSAGRRGALVKILQSEPIDGSDARVVATDYSSLSAAGVLADDFELVPKVVDPHFIAKTIEIAKSHNARIVIPTIDPEIAVFSRNRDELTSHGITAWVSEPAVADLGWDKWLFHRWLESQGLPSIETYEVRDLPRAGLSGAIVAKPRNGSSSIGVLRAPTIGQIDLTTLDDSYIVQQHVPGVEVTVDVAIGKHGNVLAAIPRRRIEVRSGEVSKGVTVDYPEVVAVATAVCQALPGAYGVVNVQVFFDVESRSVRVLELNPRFGGGYPLTHRAGGNLVRALLDDMYERPNREISWRAGTLMLRYDAEVVVGGFDIRSLDA